ncbi:MULTISPECIES: hypothetical protein [Microbacterium]|uniref:Uncharacterized protein n=2 Tax=Microbacterium maritypicum TaxID=33918 RepID=A0AAJ5SFT6_MICMQ|nr:MULTISPECIES: hypothetical protein [Microbacterium]MBP5800857.1 hypothetical protein [Microbacterium liquefaciens]UTT52199.1 hypothetical protein NMQ05_14100 [Microbacterium liquefaciens]WEF20239.1 hypothetical protein PWF71_13250 [Microbacterium liquefaciens]
MRRSIVLGVITGIFTGIIALALVMVVSLALTFANGADVVIPGIFESWSGAAPDGTPQLRFLPNFAGMGVVLLVWTAVITLLFVYLAKPRSRASVADAPGSPSTEDVKAH